MIVFFVRISIYLCLSFMSSDIPPLPEGQPNFSLGARTDRLPENLSHQRNLRTFSSLCVHLTQNWENLTAYCADGRQYELTVEVNVDASPRLKFLLVQTQGGNAQHTDIVMRQLHHLLGPETVITAPENQAWAPFLINQRVAGILTDLGTVG